MTEEVGRGAEPPLNGSAPDPPRHRGVHASPGGRLKFYKNGKFILELESACEGERTSWVSVPRKTYWPPTQTPPQTPPQAPPRSAHRRAPSLSVSDDNSSIQSSPWQRDHCWKQANPRKGLSKDLVGCYYRPAELPSAVLTSSTARRKRRRPFDPVPVRLPNGLGTSLSNGSSVRSTDNCCNDGENSRIAEASTVDDSDKNVDKQLVGIGRFKFFKYVCDTVKERVIFRVHKKLRKPKKRSELCKIIQMLTDRLPAQPLTVSAKISSLNCKQEHAMVSPRKRILRELERVSIGPEDAASKRSRSRSTVSVKPGPSTLKNDTVVTSAHISMANQYNGSSSLSARRESPASKPVSSYSINSLLSMSEDSSSTRKSPEAYASKKLAQSYNYTPHKTESPVSTHSPDLCSSPDNLDYRRTLRPFSHVPHSFGSPGYSGHSSISPHSSEKYFYQDPYVNPEDSPSIPYQIYTPPTYYSPQSYFNTSYPSYGPRGPPPIWLPYSQLPPGPWAPLPHPLLNDHLPREDTSSDLPLNLSKH